MGRAIFIKDAQIKKTQPKCANCKGPHVASYKECPAYKTQAFRQDVVDSQKSYASILCQNSVPPQPQDKAFTFLAEQFIKFVADVAIQIAQPQVCCANPNQDAIDKKSNLCRRVSEAAKNHLGVNITGISLFDAIGQLRPTPNPRHLLPKVKPHSNSHHPPKSPNHQPYLNLSAPPPPFSSTNKVVPKQPKPSK